MQANENLRAGTGAAADSSKMPPLSESPSETSDPAAEPSPELLTPEQEAALEAEREVKELLTAYQLTLVKVEKLPAVIWMPWSSSGPGRHVKIPYLRMFLRFFVAHHVNRNLNVLSRRLHADAALADDPDLNKSSREMIKLFSQSLPPPPYRSLIFAVIGAALVFALPLQAFGNVFYVLDLVGALLRLDVGYAGRAFAGKELMPTIRSLAVLIIGLVVVAALLTSPFGLKRALFNTYPWRTETLESTEARSHGHRMDGIYALEADVFAGLGAQRPREGRWDLWLQTFLLSFLVGFTMLLALLTVAAYLRWDVYVSIDVSDLEGYNLFLPDVSWVYYALVTALVFVPCVLLLWRVSSAWRTRSPHRSATEASIRRSARSTDTIIGQPKPPGDPGEPTRDSSRASQDFRQVRSQ